MTPEQHYDQLMEAIDYEIATYGLASLLDVIATMVEEDDEEWGKDIRHLAYEIAKHPHREELLTRAVKANL